jgi:hypothetical protein
MIFPWVMAMLSAPVHAVSVRASVTNVENASAVHILFGDDGETVSSCVPSTDGWSCAGVDIDGFIDAHLMIDTSVISVGPLAIEGPDLTLARTKGGVDVRWARGLEPVEGSGVPVLFVRVNDPGSERAPMLRLSSGSFNTEVGCADDGSFPDGIPNDGIFHCAKVLPPGAASSDRATLEVSVRAQNGEVVVLGSFVYTGASGLRFATVTVGDASQASSEPYALVGPKVQDPGDDKDADPSTTQTPDAEQHPEPSPPVTPVVVAPPSSGHAWVWALLALAVGLLLGRRGRAADSVLDGAVALPVQPLDGRGPIPDVGSVVISSAGPSDTLLHVARGLMTHRRVLILGCADTSSLDPIHPVHCITDPDRHAIHAILKTMNTDGGLPPVLLIEGSESVLDTGGASPTPTQDLMTEAGVHTWIAVFVSEGPTPSLIASTWGYDSQAGWTRL